MEGIVKSKGLEVGRSSASSRNWQMTGYDQEIVYKLAQFREAEAIFVIQGFENSVFNFIIITTKNH